MQLISRSVTSIVLAASLATAAQTGERAWYLAVEGGVNWTDAEVGGVVASPLCGLLFPCVTDTSTDMGWAGFAAFGTKIGENFRLEAEVGHRASVLGDRGDIANTTLMLNGRLDVPVSESLALSLGGGIGVDFVTTDRSVLGPVSTDSDTVFAYQLIAGASYELSDQLDLTLTYRYLGNAGIDTLYADARIDGAAGPTAIVSVVDVDASTLSIGLRFAL